MKDRSVVKVDDLMRVVAAHVPYAGMDVADVDGIRWHVVTAVRIDQYGDHSYAALHCGPVYVGPDGTDYLAAGWAELRDPYGRVQYSVGVGTGEAGTWTAALMDLCERVGIPVE